jgi:5-methylcytosine-specific restriction endonuclease McrA
MCDAETHVGLNTSRQRSRWRQIIAEDHGWSCHWCGQGMRMETGYMNTVTIEHMIPRCQGGTNHRWNLAAACHRCNSVRRHTSMDEFEIISKRLGPDDRTIEEVALDNRRARKQRARARKRVASTITLRDRAIMWMHGVMSMVPA